MDNEELLENYSKRLGSLGKTRSLYLRYAGSFLEYVKGDFEREKIDRYITHLRRQKYSDGSINLIFRIARTLCSRNNIDWPYNRGESPQIREDRIQAPALDPTIIGEMIQAVKTKGDPDEKAFLAISTTYATRRIEMVGLIMDDVHIKDRTIHITTAKHGRERTHMIPEEIIPHIEGYDFDVKRSESEIFTLWYRLEYRIGLDHTNQVGWHCVPPGTEVLTPYGLKAIEQVGIGGKVWGKGHGSYDGRVCGKFSRVMDTFQHEYDGEMIQVKSHGLLPLPLLTPNHPLLIKRRNVIAPRARNRLFRKNLQFLPAEQVQVGDYLVVPKLPPDGQIGKIDLTPYVKKFGWGKLSHLRLGITVTEEVAEFLGRYLADGGGSKASNRIYFGHEELNEARRFARIISRCFGFKSRIMKQHTQSTLKGKPIKGWCWVLCFGGEVLRRYLKDKLKENAHEAHIPRIIFNSPPNIVRAFLKGYFEGDGYINWLRREISASTVSRGLAIELQLLATKMGLWLSISNHPSDLSRYHLGLSKSDGEKLLKGGTKIRTKGSPIMEDKSHYYCPITEILLVPYKGMVHNIEVKQGNYCLNNAVSHNSVRRTVNTLLLDQLPEATVMSFMRWKQRTSSNMAYRYSAQRFVGREGTSIKVVGEARDVDSKVFEVHPFLKYWR